jgi:hypothetical protein
MHRTYHIILFVMKFQTIALKAAFCVKHFFIYRVIQIGIRAPISFLF